MNEYSIQIKLLGKLKNSEIAKLKSLKNKED